MTIASRATQSLCERGLLLPRFAQRRRPSECLPLKDRVPSLLPLSEETKWTSSAEISTGLLLPSGNWIPERTVGLAG